VIIGGVSVTIFKVYRPQLWLGWVLQVVGAGALSTIAADTPLARAIALQSIASVGGGLVFGNSNVSLISTEAP
jgi:hypothetical protein